MKLLRIVPDGTTFGFMRFRRVSFPFSAALSVLSVILFLTVGMNFGIDFRGGTVMEMQAKSGTADLAELRHAAEALKLGDVEVQGFGKPSDVIMRIGLQPGGDAAQQEAVAKVKAALGDTYEYRRTEVVGPRVSGELVQSGTLGVVVAVLAVLVYLWFRFEWLASSAETFSSPVMSSFVTQGRPRASSQSGKSRGVATRAMSLM